MPIGLAVGMAFTLFAGAIFGLVMLGSVFGVATYTADGQQVPAAEFFAGYGVLWLVSFFVLAAIGIALWREQVWSRGLILLYWALYAAWDFGQLFNVERAFSLAWLVMLPVSAWYLYRKQAVVSYYAALANKASSRRRNPLAAQPLVAADAPKAARR